MYLVSHSHRQPLFWRKRKVELHMVENEEGTGNGSQRTRASDLQIYSQPFSSWAMVTAPLSIPPVSRRPLILLFFLCTSPRFMPCVVRNLVFHWHYHDTHTIFIIIVLQTYIRMGSTHALPAVDWTVILIRMGPHKCVCVVTRWARACPVEVCDASPLYAMWRYYNWLLLFANAVLQWPLLAM